MWNFALPPTYTSTNHKYTIDLWLMKFNIIIMVAKAYSPFQVIILSGSRVQLGSVWHRRLTSGCESPHTSGCLPTLSARYSALEGLHADPDRRRSREDAVSVWFRAIDYAWPMQLGGILQRDLKTHHRTHHTQPRQHIVYWSARKHTHAEYKHNGKYL